MAQLIEAVLNLSQDDDLELNTDLNRYSLEQIYLLSQDFLTCSEPAVMKYLGLMDPDYNQEMSQYLEEAKTLAQIREVIIAELLIKAIQETEDPDLQ
jgi:hypothetical protein